MRTIEEIYGALKQHFLDCGGVDVVEGGDMCLRLMAVAAEIFTLEAQCRYALGQAFPQTAEGEHLDYHAAVRALERRQAAAAQGRLRFYAAGTAAVELTVPAGTQCLDAAGRVFVTDEAGFIPEGGESCLVSAHAMARGEQGNVPAGSIVFIRLTPPGIERVENPEDFSGGCGEEDDHSLRGRILSSYRRLPNGANAAWYETLALDTEGVEKVVVLPRERGRGTVDIVFSAAGGVPGEELIAQVQQQMDKHREICVDVLVRAPEVKTVDISASVKAARGYSFDSVRTGVESALREYFGGHRLGEGVYKAKLLALIMGVEGVENCSLSKPTADIAVEKTGLPVAGTINISEVE